MIKRTIDLLVYSAALSKVVERIIFNQIKKYIEPFFYNLLTGFGKNHNTQHCLLKMLENWKEASDKGNFVDAVFKDFSKTFDPLNHGLLMLEAYGLNSPKNIRSNVTQRLQRMDVNNSFNL